MKISSVAGLLLLMSLSPAIAEDVPAVAVACTACHGQNGVSDAAEWPSLAGQNEDYVAAQIRAFRDGQRDSPEMAAFVSNLTEQDTVELAAYFAAQTPRAAANGDPALVATGEHLSGYCSACHGPQGRPVANAWPNIGGQQAAYLYKQLSAYKRGARIHPHMQVAVRELDDADFAALAAYYSQLDP